MKVNAPRFAAILIPLFFCAAVSAFAQPIIIDHTCTDLSQVPSYWITQAKTVSRMSYGHTSHGSQIVTGMEVLVNLYGDLYAFNYAGSGGALSFHDYEPEGDLGNPDRTTWYYRTRDLLNAPGNDRNLIMWSWCGQADGTEGEINQYLSLMSQLEADYPSVRFIYMTGHLNGTYRNGNLHQRNEQIRNYCLANNRVLFDFADIERYDPDGNDYLDLGGGTGGEGDGCQYDNGNWGVEWCAAHSGDDLCHDCDCAHSQPLNCNLKGRAFWWMMARLAGWDGQPSVPTPTPPPSVPTPSLPPQIPTPTPIPALTPRYFFLDSGDYDGDGAADVAVFRPSAGFWSVRGLTQTYFGSADDLPACGDWDGDGATEIAIFRPDTGLWSVKGLTRFYLGGAGDYAVAVRWPTDGGTTVRGGIFRPSTGLWTFRDHTRFYFGGGSDVPVPGDYDVDGTPEAGIFRASSGMWAIRNLTRFNFGQPGDQAVPADYDGDGGAAAAVFRGGSALWSVRNLTRIYFGAAGDRGVPADYEGTAASAVAIFRESTGFWSIRGFTSLYFGLDGDLPAAR